MRILLACHQFFPRCYTGTETLTLEVATELRERGHQVAIITTEPLIPGDPIPESPEIRKELYEGFQVWKLIIPKPVNLIERLDSESCDSRLVNLFDAVADEWDPEIVYIFHLMNLTSIFADQLFRRGISVYFIPTDFWMICPYYQMVRYDMSMCDTCSPEKCYQCRIGHYRAKRGRILGALAKPLQAFPRLAGLFHGKSREIFRSVRLREERHITTISGIQGVFFPNQFMQNTFHANKLSNSSEHIIPFPIPERSREVFSLEAPDGDGPLKVAFIGTLRHTKGPQVLLKACSRIKNRNDIEVRIWGAGEKKFETELKRIAAGIGWIEFRGVFPQNRFPDVLKDSDVVVVPSLWHENTPLVALSALAAKRKVIVSGVGGLSSLVDDGATGFVFPAGDSVVLASLIVRLAENRDLVRYMPANATLPCTVREYVDAFLNVSRKKG